MHRILWRGLFLSAFVYGAQAVPATAQTIAPGFAVNYTLSDLGAASRLPTSYGGLTFKYDNANMLLIGGHADNADSKIYSVAVTRNAGGHVNGFATPAAVFAMADNMDGGLAYGPNNVLFATSYSGNDVGFKLYQYKPGSAAPYSPWLSKTPPTYHKNPRKYLTNAACET